MASKRFKDVDWTLPATAEGGIQTWDGIKIAVLMDLRDELKEIRTTLQNSLGWSGNLTRELRGLRRVTSQRREGTAFVEYALATQAEKLQQHGQVMIPAGA